MGRGSSYTQPELWLHHPWWRQIHISSVITFDIQAGSARDPTVALAAPIFTANMYKKVLKVKSAVSTIMWAFFLSFHPDALRSVLPEAFCFTLISTASTGHFRSLVTSTSPFPPSQTLIFLSTTMTSRLYSHALQLYVTWSFLQQYEVCDVCRWQVLTCEQYSFRLLSC